MGVVSFTRNWHPHKPRAKSKLISLILLTLGSLKQHLSKGSIRSSPCWQISGCSHQIHYCPELFPTFFIYQPPPQCFVSSKQPVLVDLFLEQSVLYGLWIIQNSTDVGDVSPLLEVSQTRLHRNIFLPLAAHRTG